MMDTYKKNGCREKNISSTISYKLLSHSFQKLVQSTITTLLLLPALFSCQKSETDAADVPVPETKAILLDPGNNGTTGIIDIFTFDADGARHLDSYQHYESFSGSSIGLRSQSGDKHIFICANGQRSASEWTSVNSMESLEGMHVELKDERMGGLCATGQGIISAGSGISYPIEMRLIAGEIVLNSIRCDFRGKSYEGEKITDVAVYLTNVNCRCSITAEGETVPSGIVNAGRADPEDMAEFADPGILYKKMKRSIDDRTTYAAMHFICYPNASPREGPGTPFTRLVIEGKIGGETFWWPIDINRGEDTENPGIYRNTSYIFDICITRKGAADPDTVIETEDATVNMRIMPWKEKEERQEIF